jgi:hypothetical protein
MSLTSSRGCSTAFQRKDRVQTGLVAFFDSSHIEDGNNRANQSAEIARVMNVGDAHETRNVREIVCYWLSRIDLMTMAETGVRSNSDVSWTGALAICSTTAIPSVTSPKTQ